MSQDTTLSPYFRLLVIFRWVSLLPAVFLIGSAAADSWRASPALLLTAAAAVNLFVTLAARRLNRLLLAHPWVLLLDLAFSFGLAWASGGGDGPFYLYSLSPLVAAAFFFQLPGGLLAAASYTALYSADRLLAGAAAQPDDFLTRGITQLAGVWLIPAVVGALARISEDLQAANAEADAARSEQARQNLELSMTHQRLQTIHDLTLLLQAAPDVRTMQEQVLTTLHRSLQYPRALLGLLKPGTPEIFYGWKAIENDAVRTVEPSPLAGLGPGGRVEEIMRSLHPGPLRPEDAPPGLQAWMGSQQALVIPLIFHEQTVGVLVLPSSDEVLDERGDPYTLIRTLANQAATSLGTTMLCVERAQDLAVEQERNRIAREIHDTVSQSLFGMIFSLDACIRMLPNSVDAVRQELIELQSLANLTRDQVRHSIFDLWPSSLTLDIFQADLNHYVSHCFRLVPFDIRFEVRGEFNGLSPAIRRTLYRITQEALTNALHHAGVDRAMVTLAIDDQEADLMVEDAGIGFDVESALSHEYSGEHFGLHGIRERTQAMGGTCTIASAPGQGTRIRVRVPLKKTMRSGDER